MNHAPTQRPLRRQKKKELHWSRVMMVVSVLGMLGLLNVHLRGEVIEAQYRTQQVQLAIQQARQEIRSLRMEVSQLENPDRLESWARRHAGMVRPDKKVFAYKSAPITEAVAIREE